MIRSRWAAVGAAVAVSLGAGGIGLVNATVSSGNRAVFVPITPCRITDTRPATQVGPRGTPIGPDETQVVQAWGTNGNCIIPNDATALSLNVTALAATQNSFITIWGDGTKPIAASLNPIAGAGPLPNAVNTPLTTTGAFKVFNSAGSVHIVIDINGYYADHNHDDRYYTEAESNAMSARVGYETGAANFSTGPGQDVADDVATLTVVAPSGIRSLTVVTATVHVNTSGDQQSSWDLDVAKNAGTPSTAMTRVVSVTDPGGTDNPSDTIMLSTQIVQDPGDTDVVTVSGAWLAGVPLANIAVEISSVTAPFDSSGAAPPAPG